MKTLPEFIDPMLAKLAAPFDSPEHFFEVKWDGFRSLAIVDGGGLRLIGRQQTDFTHRFPELAALSELPRGTILDGEIVLFRDGRPDFQALLRRERRWSASKRPKFGSRQAAVTFVAFDLLYRRFASSLREPLRHRRERLETLLQRHSGERLMLSPTRRGEGRKLFEEVCQLGLEGVVAKRIVSRYEPGERSGAWAKFKPRQTLICAIIGYLQNSTGGVKSLLLGANVEGEFRFVGLVGSGIEPAVHRKLLAWLGRNHATSPVVTANISGARWVKPELFCRVSFMEWTNGGKLRAPVFEALLDAMRYEDGP